jgi:NodT family efflux transporter outer membrane factor (OMF) lipoprotein
MAVFKFNFAGRRHAGALASASVAALILAGCASLPASQPARVAKNPALYSSEAAFAAPAGAFPVDEWWRGYGDAQLDELIAEALRGSPTLAQAEARVRKAQAVRAGVAADGLPNLSANGQIQELKQSYNDGFPASFVPHGYQDYGLGTLNFKWEIDFWGRNRAAVAAASSRAQAAAADAAEARLMLTTNLAAGYATLAQLYAERDLAQRAIEVREETARLTQQRLTNGLDTQAELKQAQAGPHAGQASLAEIDEEIIQTRYGLAAMMGEGPDRGLAISRPGDATLRPFGLPADLKINLLGRRPDVVAARWRAEAASRDIAAAKAAFYPNINIAAYIGSQALHLDNLVAAGSGIGAVGPALSLPIFDGGRLRANLRGAQADRDGAVADYDSAVTEALREVADAAASAKSLQTRLAESRAALADNEAAYKIATLRYQGGLSTFQSVLLAEDALLTQRRVVSDLESRGFALDIALVRALGGGFHGA